MAELYLDIVLDTYQSGTLHLHDYKKRVVAQVTEQNNRITKSRELLFLNAIDASEYKEIKKVCEEKMVRFEAKLKSISEKTPSDVNFVELTHKAMSNLKNLAQIYREADMEGKGLLLVRLFQKNGIFQI